MESGEEAKNRAEFMVRRAEIDQRWEIDARQTYRLLIVPAICVAVVSGIFAYVYKGSLDGLIVVGGVIACALTIVAITIACVRQDRKKLRHWLDSGDTVEPAPQAQSVLGIRLTLMLLNPCMSGATLFLLMATLLGKFGLDAPDALRTIGMIAAFPIGVISAVAIQRRL